MVTVARSDSPLTSPHLTSLFMEEPDNRKKRLTTTELEIQVDNKKLKAEEEEHGGASGAAGDPAVTPTEEEVDEFFAILRRMKPAVKYFDGKGMGGKEWRAVLEHPPVPAEDAENVDDHHLREKDGGDVEKREDRVVIMKESFDLNAVAPEAADDATDV